MGRIVDLGLHLVVVVLIDDLWQHTLGELQAVVRRAPRCIHRVVHVVAQIGRPAQPVAILILGPLHAEVSGLQPVKDHLVVGIGRGRAAVVGAVGTAARALGGVLRGAVGLDRGGIITDSPGCVVDHRRGRQTRIPVVGFNRSAQVDRRVIDVGRAHQIHHIDAQGIIDVVAQPDVAEVFNQDPAFHVVGVDLPVVDVFLKGQSGQILRRLYWSAGDVHLLGHGFRHAAVVNRIDRSDPTIRDRHTWPAKTFFRPVNRPHLGNGVRRNGKRFRRHTIDPGRRRQRHPGDLHPPRLRGVNLFRVRAVIVTQRRRHRHRRRGGDRLVGLSR